MIEQRFELCLVSEFDSFISENFHLAAKFKLGSHRQPTPVIGL